VTEYRRILLDGAAVQVVRHGDELRASDGRTIGVDEAVHLPPSEPTKIIAVHLNYPSRSDEFMTKLPPAPTYFHKPITALNSHQGAVVRPAGCQWLNYEGEIVIVIGRTCRNVSPAEAGDYIAGYSVGNDFGLHDFRDTDAGSMLRVRQWTAKANLASMRADCFATKPACKPTCALRPCPMTLTPMRSWRAIRKNGSALLQAQNPS